MLFFCGFFPLSIGKVNGAKVAKRDKDGDENDVFAEKTAFLQFFKKKILEKKLLFILEV